MIITKLSTLVLLRESQVQVHFLIHPWFHLPSSSYGIKSLHHRCLHSPLSLFLEVSILPKLLVPSCFRWRISPTSLNQTWRLSPCFLKKNSSSAAFDISPLGKSPTEVVRGLPTHLPIVYRALFTNSGAQTLWGEVQSSHGPCPPEVSISYLHVYLRIMYLDVHAPWLSIQFPVSLTVPPKDLGHLC